MDKLHQPRLRARGGAGASETVVNNHVHYAGPMSAPKCPSHPGAAHSYFGAALSSKNKEKKTILRIYGFEGEAGREGEGRTRIPESSRRRGAQY